MQFFRIMFQRAVPAIIISLLVSSASISQSNYWQQHIQYKMDVKLDVKTNQLSGTQSIAYINNSPDTLRRLFFHLYYNAFKPGSMMDQYNQRTENVVIGRDAKGRDVTDSDSRFKVKVQDLHQDEYGSCHVNKVVINGREQQLKEHETILEVLLDKPLLPKQSISLQTVFEEQVPKLSRRSGRDNPEGIRYSMGQWYPKLCEYDKQGWHADDYVGREFYGPWGDFEVNITLQKDYKVGAGAILQNASEIGWGYDKEGSPLKEITGSTRTWKFKVENVHDFAWTADPGYIHFTRTITDGPLLHFIYKFTDSAQQQKWIDIADSVVIAYPYMAKTFGPYAYPVYSFLHGGGGGTEYPMACMLRGAGIDGAIHEWMHSWYQMMLGTNENLYAWMDEGFTEYADERVKAHIQQDEGFFLSKIYDNYFRLATSRLAEPMSTPANFFSTNFAYNYNSYYKGAVYLSQLGYIAGDIVRDKILLEYYQRWKFKHPTPSDFIKVAEDVSGMHLKWYQDLWVNTTKTIDYKIDSLWTDGFATYVRMKQLGEIPMPLDIMLSFKDGSHELHYIPLSLTYNSKAVEDTVSRIVYPAQPWTDREMTIRTTKRINEIIRVEIDPSQRMADIDRKNNKLELSW